VNLLSAWLLGEAGHSHGPGHQHHHDHHDHDHDHHDHDHDHDHDHHDHDHHAVGHSDLNKKAAYIHVLTDAATSVLAILALAGGMLWGAAWLDPVMGFIGGILILYWAKGLLRETTSILIDAESHGVVSEQIRDIIAQQGSQLLDLHVWRIGENRYAAIVGVPTLEEAQLRPLRHRLEQIQTLAHLTLEAHPR
jgi:cation diffusion facilitator family transporter